MLFGFFSKCFFVLSGALKNARLLHSIFIFYFILLWSVFLNDSIDYCIMVNTNAPIRALRNIVMRETTDDERSVRSKLDSSNGTSFGLVQQSIRECFLNGYNAYIFF